MLYVALLYPVKSLTDAGLNFIEPDTRVPLESLDNPGERGMDKALFA